MRLYNCYFVILIFWNIFSAAMSVENRAEQVANQKNEFKKQIYPLIEASFQLAARSANGTLRPFIAISGSSGVGKSKFTARFAQILEDQGVKTAIFRMDDFLQPTPCQKPKMHAMAHRNFDPYRLHEVIQKVKDGQNHIRKPVWDHMTWKHSVKVEADACYTGVQLVLCEGIYALCGPDTYDFLKYSEGGIRVFIDAPTELIEEWNWNRDQKGPKPRAKEQYEADVAWDREDFQKVTCPTKVHANFVIIKDRDHNYTISS